MKKDPPEYIPGESAEVSGTYELLNFAGTPTGQTVAVEEGQALPPAPLGWTWRLIPDDAPNSDSIFRGD